MCASCGWEQALTDIKMLQESDGTHVLDLPQLDRMKAGIELRQCVTPWQKKDLLKWCEQHGCDRGAE